MSPKPTAEERAEFKRGELQAVRDLMCTHDVETIRKEVRDDIRARVDRLRATADAAYQAEQTGTDADFGYMGQLAAFDLVLAAISSSSATETEKIDLWGNPNRAERMRSGADHGDFFIGSGLCKTCREPYPCKASEEPLPSSATETQDGERPGLREALPSLHNGIRQALVLGLTDVTITMEAAVAIRDSFIATPTPDDRDREVERIERALHGLIQWDDGCVGKYDQMRHANAVYDRLRASGGTE